MPKTGITSKAQGHLKYKILILVINSVMVICNALIMLQKRHNSLPRQKGNQYIIVKHVLPNWLHKISL